MCNSSLLSITELIVPLVDLLPYLLQLFHIKSPVVLILAAQSQPFSELENVVIFPAKFNSPALFPNEEYTIEILPSLYSSIDGIT